MIAQIRSDGFKFQFTPPVSFMQSVHEFRAALMAIVRSLVLKFIFNFKGKLKKGLIPYSGLIGK